MKTYSKLILLIFYIALIPGCGLAEAKELNLSEIEKKTENKRKLKAAEQEYLTLFTGINRSKEIFDTLKELAPDMIAKGEDENWTQIKIKFVQSGKTTYLTFNHDKEYYSGKKWQIQKVGMYNYFSQFPASRHKKRALRLVKRLNFAVATIFEPGRVKDDERLKLILRLSKKIRAVMFAPGSLMDLDGKVIMSADGYGDPKATVDL